MNAKMILSAVMAVAAGAGIPAFADTEAYTSGDTSLANGKPAYQTGSGYFAARGLIISFL